MRKKASATLFVHVNAIQSEPPGISFCKIFLLRSRQWQNRIWDTSRLSDSSWFLSIVNWPRKLKEKGGHNKSRPYHVLHQRRTTISRKKGTDLWRHTQTQTHIFIWFEHRRNKTKQWQSKTSSEKDPASRRPHTARYMHIKEGESKDQPLLFSSLLLILDTSIF